MSDAPVSNPQAVPMEEPPVDIQALLDQQASQFESQISALRQQEEERLTRERQSAKQIITARLADYGLEALGEADRDVPEPVMAVQSMKSVRRVKEY